MVGLLQGANFHFPCLSDPEAVVKEVFPVRLPSSTRALGQEAGVDKQGQVTFLQLPISVAQVQTNVL